MYSSGSFTTDGESFKKRSFLIAHRAICFAIAIAFLRMKRWAFEKFVPHHDHPDRSRMWSASSDPSAGNA